MKRVRNRAFAKWIITTAILMAFILGLLSIYWGVFSHADQNLSSLVVYVVDFDGVAPYESGPEPFVGPAIVRLTQQMVNSGKPHLGYVSPPASGFNNDPMQVRQAVYDWDAWAAIIINPNATAMLYSAIATGNTSYDPLGACQLVYQDARDDTNWYDFMLPQISMMTMQAQSVVGKQWANMVLQNASDTSTLRNMQAVPQAINPAIGFSEYNLRPFYPQTATPAVSVGLICTYHILYTMPYQLHPTPTLTPHPNCFRLTYPHTTDLIIISFFSFSFYMPIHTSYLIPSGHPPLKFHHLILWRYLATLTAYIFLSLAYSLISLAFQINFSTTNPTTSETLPTMISAGNPTAYGPGTFPLYWLVNFIGMCALGLACENVAMVVGTPWMGLWLIFWVITNVSTAFYALDIAPGFYAWGYAWPLHSVVEASRMLLFDLKSHFGRDLGILVAWWVGNTMLFPGACWFLSKWRGMR